MEVLCHCLYKRGTILVHPHPGNLETPARSTYLTVTKTRAYLLKASFFLHKLR